ncbi:MAG: phosphoribosyltransferase family protein [Acidilobaceae archaeon]
MSRALSKVEKLKTRMLAVEALRAVRRTLPYSYRQLARMMGFDETLLARYASGITIPSYEQSLELLKSIKEVLDPVRLVLSRAGELKGLIDLTPVLSDPFMLKLLSIEFYERFRDDNVTKILVPEAGGITLATSLALVFEVPLVIARRSKENPLLDYLEEHLVEPPSVKCIFYVPKGSIRRDDRVLIVDDVVQSGITLAIMKRIVERAGASLVGVAALIVIGNEWRKRVSIDRIEAIAVVSKT